MEKLKIFESGKMLPAVSMTKEFCHPERSEAKRGILEKLKIFESGKMLPTVSMTKEFCHPERSEERDLGEAKYI